MKCYFLCLCFGLSLLVSCSREDFTGEWEEEITIPPSEEVDVDDINGIIKNVDGTLIPNANIVLIGDHDELSSTVSDEQGSFVFHDIIINREYYLQISKSNFITSYIKLDLDSLGVNNLDIQLLENVDGEYVDNPLSVLSDNNIILSGRLVNDLLDPVSRKLFYTWDNSPSVYIHYSESGHFSIVVPKDEILWLATQDDCSYIFAELNAYNGPFHSNHDLGEIVVDASDIQNISGIVEYCNPDSLIFGDITLIDIGMGGNVIETVPIENGEFSFEANLCDLSIPIFSVSTMNSVFPVLDVNIISETNPNEILISICDDNMFPSYGEIYLDHETDGEYEFNEVNLIADQYDIGHYCIYAFDELNDQFISGILLQTGASNFTLQFDFIQLGNNIYVQESPVFLDINYFEMATATGMGVLDAYFEGVVSDLFFLKANISGNIEIDLPSL